jgi:hypothetical protein
VRCLYRTDSLLTVLRVLSTCTLDLVRVKEIRWEGGGTEAVGEYTFFYRKGMRNMS